MCFRLKLHWSLPPTSSPVTDVEFQQDDSSAQVTRLRAWQDLSLVVVSVGSAASAGAVSR